MSVTEDSCEAMETIEVSQNEDEHHKQPGIEQTQQFKTHAVSSDVRETLKTC